MVLALGSWNCYTGEARPDSPTYKVLTPHVNSPAISLHITGSLNLLFSEH